MNPSFWNNTLIDAVLPKGTPAIVASVNGYISMWVRLPFVISNGVSLLSPPWCRIIRLDVYRVDMPTLTQNKQCAGMGH